MCRYLLQNVKTIQILIEGHCIGIYFYTDWVPLATESEIDKISETDVNIVQSQNKGSAECIEQDIIDQSDINSDDSNMEFDDESSINIVITRQVEKNTDASNEPKENPMKDSSITQTQSKTPPIPASRKSSRNKKPSFLERSGQYIMCQNKISNNDWLERIQYLRSLAEEKVFRQMQCRECTSGGITDCN